ncbi:MAG TPA: hypothetical protein VHO06_27985 [Polyangia bacterium]|nr:hypothetical protein [Polyangia bacterium]
MEIPAALYGTQKEVSGRVRAMVKEIGAGAPLGTAVGVERINTNTTAAMIVLQGRSRLISQIPTIHIYEPLFEIRLAVSQQKLPREITERLFEEALTEPWSVLSLIASANQMWVYPESRHRLFWDRVVEWWPIFEAVGPHYTYGGSQETELWSVPNNVHYVAVHLGVPEEVVKRRPLPPGGITALAVMTRRLS